MSAERLTPLKCAEIRHATLWAERGRWLDHWRDISRVLQPRLGRFLVTDVNKGDRRNTGIYDNTGMRASRILAAGMMSGMTSPARPWFKLSLADKELAEQGEVRTWLHLCGSRIREVFNASNVYRGLHAGYEELGLFGTWSTLLEDDFDTVTHMVPFTIGEYAIGVNEKGRPNAFAREFPTTVDQLVEKFGKENCSVTVQNMYDNHKLDSWIPVKHVIEPNRYSAGEGPRDNRKMKFSSIYYEAAGNHSKPLRESGYTSFPILAPRWATTSQDIYGHGPGMEALGDVRQLQHEQLRKGQGIDYMANPPITVPTAYKDAQHHRLPGGVLFSDDPQKIRSAFDVRLDLQHLLGDIQDVRERINNAFYVDMFLMLANDTRSGVTATEVAERHEEKLLMLGPVLERLHDELLSPLIDRTFERCARVGILPPPPEALRGMEVNIEFVSTLAQAQRIVSAKGMDRLLGTLGSISAIWPEARDKIDIDQVIDDYGDMYGVNPEIIVPDDKVAEIRQQRAAQAQAQAAGMAAAEGAKAAKDASAADPDKVREVMGMFQGYSSPQPAEI